MGFGTGRRGMDEFPSPGTVTRSLPQASRLASISCSTESYKSEHHTAAVLVDERSTFAAPRLLLSGWACRHRIMADGRRQILEVLIPGDILGVPSFGSIVALTPVRVAQIPIRGVHSSTGINPVVSELIAETEHEGRLRILDQIMRLGHMNGLERMAHLLLELQRRLLRVKLGRERTFPLPLTQQDLGDVLGMSVVHVNRTLQQLRHKKIIAYSSGELTIISAKRLAALANGTGVKRG